MAYPIATELNELDTFNRDRITRKQETKKMKRMTRIVYATVVSVIFGCFAPLPSTQAVLPPPEGGYPGNNTAVGENALQNLTTGINNTALGYRALHDNTVGVSNTAVGSLALRNNIGGDRNTATGLGALFDNENGNDNTANGFRALVHNRANANTAIGSRALENNNAGHDNIAVGFRAGANFSPGSNNIYIGNVGLTAENGTIRIGDPSQTRTFIAGIAGSSVTGAPVSVNDDGQLGTTPSSQRFKDEIKPMDKASEAIFALEPVTFHYKKDLDPDGIRQFGLVAEELARVNSDLVARDAAGKPYTVRYDAVNAMLLNEFLKEHRKVEELESVLAQLTARLQEQALKVQKMSEQLAAGNESPIRVKTAKLGAGRIGRTESAPHVAINR
jgi:trimeric autotransporter adhesin